ncbi:MAG: hypothetical protein K2P18_00405, partial [Oscillospiraceae bacterium]|nr:hypothetical protein [Oscillospiraceae bacterium]
SSQVNAAQRKKMCRDGVLIDFKQALRESFQFIGKPSTGMRFKERWGMRLHFPTFCDTILTP